MAAESKIDPMHQFQIDALGGGALDGTPFVFTNSALWMLIVFGAILLFILNLIGLGGGPLYLGRVSDMAKAHYGAQSLMVGYAALAPVIIIVIIMHLVTASSIARDKRLAAAI